MNLGFLSNVAGGFVIESRRGCVIVSGNLASFKEGSAGLLMLWIELAQVAK